MKYENKELLGNYKTKAEEHWFTIFNPILNYLGNLKGKKVLDVGCGTGEFTYELSKRAGQVVGIDLSKKWIESCRVQFKKDNLRFIQQNANDLKNFKSEYFDVVIMNMVVPNIYIASGMRKVFKEISRVTKKSGDFVFSDLHPVCVMTKKAGRREQKYSKDFSYLKEGAKFSAFVTLPDGKKIEFDDAHWSLGFYADVLNESGLRINKIIESEYPENAPKKFYRHPFPEYITFCCKKLKK